MGTYFTGKQLNKKGFDQNFAQMTNQHIELNHQLEQKEGRYKLWFNEDVQLHELANVITKLHNTACSFDKNNFQPNMIVKSCPIFRTCLVNLFNACLTNSQWPWTDSRVLSFKNLLSQSLLTPLHNDPSA